MRKAYSYSRSNRGSSGIEFQQTQIKQYTATRGVRIDKQFSDITSGTQIGNNLQKLVTEIPSGSLLLVTKRSRISRNSNDYQLIYNELISKNIEVVFVDEL